MLRITLYILKKFRKASSSGAVVMSIASNASNPGSIPLGVAFHSVLFTLCYLIKKSHCWSLSLFKTLSSCWTCTHSFVYFYPFRYAIPLIQRILQDKQVWYVHLKIKFWHRISCYNLMYNTFQSFLQTNSSNTGVKALVLVPTKELAKQAHRNIKVKLKMSISCSMCSTCIQLHVSGNV